MPLLSATRLVKSFGTLPVLSGVSLSIEPGEKIGLVGRNGVGKSTLLRILAGREAPDGGTVHLRAGARVGYLPQLPEPGGERTLWEEVASAFADLAALEARLATLEAQLEGSDVHGDPAHLETVLEEYARARDRYERAGGFTYEATLRRALRGLGFREEQFAAPLGTLSGGQRSRAALARVLLDAPDLLLLDEPTNHLDLDALEWLQEALAEYRGAMVLVSHDRYLLDAVTSRTLELEAGRIEDYPGPYSFYVTEREARRARQQELFDRQQEEARALRAFIDRYRAGQRSRQAKSREKRLEKLPRIAAPRTARTLSFRWEVPRRTPATLVRARGLAKRFGPVEVLREATFEIHRQDRVALIGPNGAGKTTLLRILAGRERPSSGLLEVTSGVRVGYLPQDADETLDPGRTVLEQALGDRPLEPEQVRRVLGRFLFSGEEADKPVGQLSGGERRRLALATLVLDRPDLLLLDEPTTHFDLPSLEALEEALLAFPGAILLVSHDRALIDRVARRLLVLLEGRLAEFRGPYHVYRERLASPTGAPDQEGAPERALGAAPGSGTRKPVPREGDGDSGPRRDGKGVSRARPGEASEEVVARILRLEEEQGHLGRLLGDPELYRDADRARETVRRYEEVARALEALYAALAEAEGELRA
jgi:ATP-binding cassette subfamily F protein 3